MLTKTIITIASLLIVAGCTNRFDEFSIPTHNTEQHVIEKKLDVIIERLPSPVFQSQSKPRRLSPKIETLKGKPVPPMISMGNGVFCSAKSVQGERERNWKLPGANAFTGGIYYGIEEMKVPREVKDAWIKAYKKALKNKTFLRRTLRVNEKFCDMMYSVPKRNGKGNWHKRWPNVKNGAWVTKANADNGAKVIKVDFGGYVWELIIPDVCDNVSYRATRKVVSKVEAPKLGASSKPLVAQVKPAQRASQTVSSEPFYVRVRFWEWKSIPARLQAKIKKVNKGESAEAYAFEDGAVSRNLTKDLIISWRNNKATTVRRLITAKVSYPTSKGYEKISVKPGDHAKYPNLVYWEKYIPRKQAAYKKSQFVVQVSPSQECSVVYPREKDGIRQLTTRLGSRPKDLSELATSATERSGTVEGFNLNVILNCDGSA